MSYQAVPTATFPPSSIQGSTAFSQAFITGASSAATARTLFGIEDLATQLSQSIAHAKTVCAFAFSPQVLEFRMDQRIAGVNGGWGAVILSASSTNTVDSAGETGGSSLLTTSGLSAGEVQWLSVSNGLGVFAGSVMPDLVRAQDKWHYEFDFRLNSTPDAQTNFGQGWIAPDGTPGVWAGVQGATSTAKFRIFLEGVGGVSSTLNIDTARHRVRVWANGSTPGQIFGSFDGETPVSFTGATFGKAAGPYGHIANGTTLAAQNVNMFNSIYVHEGVA